MTLRAGTTGRPRRDRLGAPVGLVGSKPQQPGCLWLPIRIAAPLFDERPRDDREIQRSTESTYKFLDRVHDEAFAHVRELLNAWFSRFAQHQPADAVNDLRGRLKAKPALQFESAFWELYLHELYWRLDFEVEVHPPGPRTTRPDFLMTRGFERFYMEAVVPVPTEGTLDQPPGSATVTEYIEAARSPDFILALRFVAGGGPMPRRKKVITAVERWLATLSWSDFHGGRQAAPVMPETEVAVDDWVIGLRAHPRPPDDRGRSDTPTIGIFPGTAAWPDAVMAATVPTLDEKASKYGELDAPHVIAAWVMSPYAHEHQVCSALHSADLPLEAGRQPIEMPPNEQRRGLWTPDRGRRDRPSAVLLAGSFDFSYNAIGRHLPRLWHNPWAQRPLEAELPFAASRVAPDELTIDNTPATASASAIFGVDLSWPGEPFAHLNRRR